MGFISIRSLIVEQMERLDPSWFHIGYGRFQTPDGRRFYRNKQGKWTETRASKEGTRWPDPRSSQDQQKLPPTSMSSAVQTNGFALVVQDRLDRRRGIVGHASTKVEGVAAKLLEELSQLDSISDVSDMVTLMTPLAQEYDRPEPAPLLIISDNPLDYFPDSIEEMLSETFKSSPNTDGVYIHEPLSDEIDHMAVRDLIGDRLFTAPIRDWEVSQWLSLKTFIHENLHSTKSAGRMDSHQYFTGVQITDKLLYSPLEEGLTEYMAKSIVAGMIDDDDMYSEFMRISLNYRSYTNAINLMAVHGDLDIDGAWRDISMVGDTPRMFIKIQEAQSTAIKTILQKAGIADDKISDLLELVNDLWDNGICALTIPRVHTLLDNLSSLTLQQVTALNFAVLKKTLQIYIDRMDRLPSLMDD
jgi:hypothetical protein